MRNRQCLSIVTTALAMVSLLTGWTAAKDGKPSKSTDRTFQKLKKDYQQKIHNKKPAERIAALKLLSDFPTGDSADLIYVTLLDDKADEVRQAAVKLLASWRNHEDVSAKLLQRMTTTTRKDGMDIRAVGALQALGGTEDDELQFQVLKYLNEFLVPGTPQGNLYVLHEMIDTESPRGDAEEVLRMLMLLTRADFFDQHFGYRRCLVQGIMEVKSRNALTHLINLLPKFKGLVQYDVVTHLVAATGQNFGDDAAKWKAWWTANQGKNEPPEKVPPVTNYGNFGDYYGIPICAKRVVFVLDTSGSMRGGKLDAAKVELIRAIKELHKEVFFSIVIFNSSVRTWQQPLVPANDSMKQIAVNVVLEQDARSNTASYDALEAAFALEPEAIYFLSDGAPRGGKIDDPGEIISSVSGANRVRRISIHSIGIDTKADTSVNPFARFMQALAKPNWGQYRAVD